MAAKKRRAKRRPKKRARRARQARVGAPKGYYREPTIHGDRIAFVSDDDLWWVGLEGGLAQRLTAGGGRAAAPHYSPDGAHIAFTATYDGAQETFVIPALGGPRERLTHFGGASRTIGWTKDGKSVLVISNGTSAFAADFCIYEVPLDGSPMRTVDVGPARRLVYEPKGPGRVLGLCTGDPARWKRYRGGTRGRLLVDRTGRGRFEPLLDNPGNLASPMWIGKRVWFLSDHEGHANLYSCTPTGKSLRRHTDFEGLYARMAATDGKHVVFHRAADLWVHDVKSDKNWQLDVRLPSPRADRTRRFVPAARHLEDAALHPAGHSLAVISRGGAYSMPLWEGAVARHGEISSARYRLARWLSDGKRLVAVSDEKGEERLRVWNADGSGRARHLAASFGRALSVEVSPAGLNRVAITNNRHELVLVDLGTGRGKRIAKSEHNRIGGVAWSPDGRWLAFGLGESSTGMSIQLYDTRNGRTHAVTSGDFHDSSPAFDAEGKYLAFASAREFKPVYDTHYFDLGFQRGALGCLVPLTKDACNPFAIGTKPPKPLVAPAPRGAKKKAAKKKPRSGAGADKDRSRRDRSAGCFLPLTRTARPQCDRRRGTLLLPVPPDERVRGRRRGP